MGITRIKFGELEGGANVSPDITQSISRSVSYMPDFESYLVGLFGFAMSVEAANSGAAKPYGEEDTVMLGCRQSNSNWYWRPAPTIEMIAKNVSISHLYLERFEGTTQPNDDNLTLGALETLLFNLGQSLGVNYFERSKPQVIQKFGDVSNWPDVWNFARIVRNSMSHGGKVHFDNPNANPVSWRGLVYAPSNNGRRILHTDIWPGDLFDLITELEQAII